ncbi:MAG: BrnT family toxin [Chloroflexi bacterium]|nr:BrnT family toxin [Chloroflexota bacterium]
MLRIESLEIDDHILDKIESKHGVTFEEVEQACLSERRHVRRGRDSLYKLFCQTAAGRYVLAVLVNLGDGNWRVVTAREMTASERRLYVKATGGKGDGRDR